MKCLLFSMRLILLIFILLTVNIYVKAQNNSVSGIIFDPSGRQPVSQIYVEILNELYVTLKRVKTDSSGRYYFSGLSSGTFKVKVLTFGTNYLEQTQDATVVNFGAGNGRVSSDNIYLDFYLKLDPRKINITNNQSSTVIFAQDVPEKARTLYKKGVDQLDEKKLSGLEYLEQAIQIFPNYYDALDRLGVEYVKQKEYEKSIPHLIKSIDINRRSFTSFYALGVACFNLNKINEALEAMRAATVLNPQSINAKIWYGRLLRINGSYDFAEKTLIQAKTFTNKSPVAEIH